MSTFWNFRKILNVNPEKNWTCVEDQCLNPLSTIDRQSAGRTLDQMDRKELFQEATGQISNVASMLLCRTVRNDQVSGCAVNVEEVASKWKDVADQEYRAIKRRSSNAFAIEAQKELLLAAKHLKLELEAESGDRVSQLPPRRRSPQYNSAAKRSSKLFLFPQDSTRTTSNPSKVSRMSMPPKSEMRKSGSTPVKAKRETTHDLYHHEIRAMERSVSDSSPVRKHTSIKSINRNSTLDFFQFEEGLEGGFRTSQEDIKPALSSMAEERLSTSAPELPAEHVPQRPKKTMSHNDIRKKHNRDRASTLFKDLGMEIDKLHLMMALASIPTPSSTPEHGISYTSNPSPEEFTAAARLNKNTRSGTSSRSSSRPPKSRFSTMVEEPENIESRSDIQTTTFFSDPSRTSTSPKSSSTTSSGDYSTISIGYSTPRTFYEASSDIEIDPKLPVLAPTIYTPPNTPPQRSSRRPKPISPPRINTKHTHTTPRFDTQRRPSSTSIIITPRKVHQPWLPHPSSKRVSMPVAKQPASPVVKSPFTKPLPRSTPISKSLHSDSFPAADAHETYLTDLQIWERLTKAEKPEKPLPRLPATPSKPSKRATVLIPTPPKQVKRVDSGVFIGLPKTVDKSEFPELESVHWSGRLKKRFGSGISLPSGILGKQFRVKKSLPGWI